MMNFPSGLHHLKSIIRIQAPVEVCYRTWLNFPELPHIIKRVLRVEVRVRPENNNIKVLTSPEEIQARIQLLKLDVMPSSKIKHWLFSGPGGKLYEIENTVVLEIPNRFYCTVSTDPNDLSAQSSVIFSSDAMNQYTLIEWQVSFWRSFQDGGSMTRLSSDIEEADDSFMKDCLRDLKQFLESRGPYPSKPAFSYL